MPTQGTYRLEATRIGYGVTLSQTFFVEQQDTVTVEFRIHSDAVPVAPITVTAHSSRGQSRFARRMTDWGRGIFITPAMVDSIGPRHPADVLEKQENVCIPHRASAGGPRGGRDIPRHRRGAA